MNGLEEYLFYDKPIPYKNLLIYPAIMNDYINFHWSVTSLLLDKNSIPDPKIISMSYLSYLYFLSKDENNPPYLLMFKILLLIVLHIDTKDEDRIGFYSENGKAYILIDDIKYYDDDFEKIKNIIFEQNCIEGIDETIQKEVRDAMEKAEEYRMKQNANKIGSLEDQMICVSISSPYRLEEIYKMTIRKFSKILQRIDCKLHYQIYLSAEMSGMVTFKDKDSITHWMSDLTKKDKYKDVKIDSDEMHNKIDNINK